MLHPLRAATSQFVDVRGMQAHVLTWGDTSAPRVFMLHGWMDVAASFQFLVDALAGRWHVIAPDLRGFGRSQWQPQGYWYWDYVADLDALVAQFSPDEPVRLVGHSLGGNVVMHYAGARPQRVQALVSLDGFGIPFEAAELAPQKLARWLDALREPAGFRPYAGLAGVADRLQKTNPRLPRDKAEFLARHWASELPDGRAELTSDPRHKLPFPTTYRMEELYAAWRAITAPVLWVAGAQSDIPRWLDAHPEGETPGDGLAGVRARMAHVPGAQLAVIDDAGHMLHHDQPQAVARLIEPFLAGMQR
jgi:pimeloyl-ACP methyl ester carboxylesterase